MLNKFSILFKFYIPGFDWAWLQKAWKVEALILFPAPGFKCALSFQFLYS